MKLNVLTGTIPGQVRIVGDQNTEISNICIDSRKVQKGDLFICTPGLRMDAHNFAPQAVESGAAALLVDHVLDIDVPQVVVEDVRLATSFVAAQFHDEDSFRDIALWIAGAKRYALQEFKDSGDILTGGLTPCSPEQMQAFLSILRPCIPGAFLRGNE